MATSRITVTLDWHVLGEVAKLDHDEERALAEEGMASELASWPES